MSLRAEMRVAPAGVRQAQPGVATGQSVVAWPLGYAEAFICEWAVQETLVCNTAAAPILAALNSHGNSVCLRHLEINLYILAIGLKTQTVFHAHWLCTRIDRR